MNAGVEKSIPRIAGLKGIDYRGSTGGGGIYMNFPYTQFQLLLGAKNLGKRGYTTPKLN